MSSDGSKKYWWIAAIVVPVVVAVIQISPAYLVEESPKDPSPGEDKENPTTSLPQDDLNPLQPIDTGVPSTPSTDVVKEINSDLIEIEGTGLSPAGKEKTPYGKLAAVRAALLDAKRNAASFLEKELVISEQEMINSSLSRDEVSSRIEAYIRQVKKKTEFYDENTGIATVVVTIPSQIDI